jgi:ABC-type multidrug transport system permease subunit
MAVIGYERIVFYRERGASMYDPFAYGYAMAMVEMPYLFVQSLCFVPIMYWMVLFVPTPEAFFHYFIMFFETVCFYTIFGQFLVYITPNAGIAQVLGGFCNYLFNIFNGFVITYPAMPSGWHWMNRFSPPTWILYGLGVSQLGQSEVPVDPTLVNGQVLPVWQYVQQQFGYDYSMMWWCVLILLAYILFVRVTSILALKYWNFLRR